MAWLYLVVAGVLEVSFALGLKESHGFTRLWPSLVFAGGAMGSFFLLSRAIQTLPIGTAYAIWTGIGAAGTAVVGMVAFGESSAPLKLVSLVLIVAGVVGLRLAGGGH